MMLVSCFVVWSRQRHQRNLRLVIASAVQCQRRRQQLVHLHSVVVMYQQLHSDFDSVQFVLSCAAVHHFVVVGIDSRCCLHR